LHQSHEADENKSDDTTGLRYFSLNIAFYGKDRAILYVLNPCAYVMHVRLNAGQSLSVILKDQEYGIIGHVLS
tara:strand:- start:412 stop:630 length:219 start_codon:yes stop_codon:yes gene_type:complete